MYFYISTAVPTIVSFLLVKSCESGFTASSGTKSLHWNLILDARISVFCTCETQIHLRNLHWTLTLCSARNIHYRNIFKLKLNRNMQQFPAGGWKQASEHHGKLKASWCHQRLFQPLLTNHHKEKQKSFSWMKRAEIHNNRLMLCSCTQTQTSIRSDIGLRYRWKQNKEEMIDLWAKHWTWGGDHKNIWVICEFLQQNTTNIRFPLNSASSNRWKTFFMCVKKKKKNKNRLTELHEYSQITWMIHEEK